MMSTGINANRSNPKLSGLENIMVLPPVSELVFRYCNTTDLVCIRNTSKTMRWYLDQNMRFFRNMVFLNRGAERWEDELEKMDLLSSSNSFLYTHVKDMLRNTVSTVLDRVQAQRRRQLKDDRIMVGRILKTIDWQRDPELRQQWMSKFTEVEKEYAELEKEIQEAQHNKSNNFPRLMGRHLLQTLNSLPIGRNVTSLIIDGTGVDTAHMQHFLHRFSGKLRGLSARECPNIDCSLWSDWLLESLYFQKPVGLQWLRIWGSGNTPFTFNTTEALDPIEPLEEEVSDILPRTTPYNLPRFLCANVLPMDFHMSYTSSLVTPQHLHGVKRMQYEIAVTTVLAHQRQMKRQAQDDVGDVSPPNWIPPFYPLGDVHPILALFALAKYLNFQLDIRLCANQHNCFSFINAKNNPTPPDLTPIPGAPAPASFVIMNLATGSAYRFPQCLPQGEQLLHTHVLVEIGSRRSNGGRECGKCGLWEDAPAPPAFCLKPETTEVAGITTGPGIGQGRTVIGDVCSDCVAGMTCRGCNKFICPSCSYPDETQEENPLMDQDHADPEEIRWLCYEYSHGPFCTTCVSERLELFFECDECDEPSLCLRCYPLSSPDAHHVECPQCFRRFCGGCQRIWARYCWVCEEILKCQRCVEEESGGMILDETILDEVCFNPACIEIAVETGAGV